MVEQGRPRKSASACSVRWSARADQLRVSDLSSEDLTPDACRQLPKPGGSDIKKHQK